LEGHLPALAKLGRSWAAHQRELLNAAVLSTAVVMLGWHSIWMARHGREMAAEMTPVWNSAALLSEKRLAGRILHTLVGYSDNPSDDLLRQRG
jgi:plasmid stability protein